MTISLNGSDLERCECGVPIEQCGTHHRKPLIQEAKVTGNPASKLARRIADGHIPRMTHTATGYHVFCECGAKLPSDKTGDSYESWSEHLAAAIEREFRPICDERDSLKEQWTKLQDRLHLDFVARTEAEASLTNAIAKLRRVADGYETGGHSHRAQMLRALATEIEIESEALAKLGDGK